MRKGRLPFVIGLIFGGVGLLFGVVAVVVLASTLSSQRDAARTEGTVIDLVERTSTSRDDDGHRRETTVYHPTVRFTADGRSHEFTGDVGSDPPTYEVGDRVPVAYDPADPTDARVDTFTSLYLLPLIFGGVAVLLVGIGTPAFVLGVRRLRRDSRIRTHGDEVWASVTGVARVRNVRINYKHPYQVHASWTDPRTGATHTAVSDYVLEDPTPRLHGRSQVRVLTDPDDPSRNVMDLDAVPPDG